MLEVLSIMIPIVVALVGWWFYHKKNLKNQSSDRVSSVVDSYCKLHKSSKDKGLSSLFKAGIELLKNDDEISRVIENITKRTGKPPLGMYHDGIDEVGYFKFFDNVTKNELKEHNPHELIEIKKLKKR